MTETGTPFKHSTPELYDRYMAPLLFEPYATVVADRAARLQPDHILETAAGTGVVTRALHRAAPRAQIIATDVNPVMLEVAAQNLRSDRVSFQPADAQDLQVRAHREARRVVPHSARKSSGTTLLPLTAPSTLLRPHLRSGTDTTRRCQLTSSRR